MAKSYKELLESIKDNLPKTPLVEEKHEDILREAYINEKIFNIGDSVQTADGNLAEIISRGPNYLTLVREGNEFKCWIKDVKPISIEETPKRRTQIYKESFIIKGYKTQNFTRELSEQFKDISKRIGDTYALYSSVVCFDSLLGISEGALKEDFNSYKVSFERASKYFNKFNIQLNEMSMIEDKLLEYSLEEGLKFSVNDQLKVASIIASTAGIEEEGSAINIINAAARKFKSGSHTPEAWKLIGQMLQKADQAGIKWDHSIFAKPTLKYMGIES